MASSPARLRVEREFGRRGNAAVVISTLLSLAVVGVAVAVVAYLVLRAPSAAVDSAERLEPVGTAIVAPTEAPSLPTPIPTSNPEPTALGFTGEGPPVTGLPTVVAPAEDAAGPTPTPRVIALPIEAPALTAATLPAPAATLPPSPAEVPVVALQPVEAAPPAAPAVAPAPVDVVSEPTPEAATTSDDDPFNIFEEGEIPRIVPAQNDALERVREMQDENRAQAGGGEGGQPAVVPTFVLVEIPPIVMPTVTVPIPANPDGSVEIVMPDVAATIAAITARTTDPNRNPNISRDNNGGREPAASGNKRKRSRDSNRPTPTPEVRPARNDPAPVVPGNGGNQEECDSPFSNLPEDMRPKDWPFDDC